MANKSESLCYCSACIRARRQKIIERAKPGYWLFDRNDTKIYEGEACRDPRTGKLVTQKYLPVMEFHTLPPFSIYRWVTE